MLEPGQLWTVKYINEERNFVNRLVMIIEIEDERWVKVVNFHSKDVHSLDKDAFNQRKGWAKLINTTKDLEDIVLSPE